jgi:sodium transport system permease protein
VNDILLIYVKEVREAMRNKRALLFAIVIPTIIFPILLSVMKKYSRHAITERVKEGIHLTIMDDNNDSELFERFNYCGYIDVKRYQGSLDQAMTMISRRQTDYVVLIEPGSKKSWGRSLVKIYYDSSSDAVRIKEDVVGIINVYNESQRRKNLSSLGIIDVIDQDRLLTPLKIEECDIVTPRNKFGRSYSGAISFIFVFCVLTGCLYPAIDLGAGEKERGTLETLLLTPASRLSIALGKYFVIFTFGILAFLCSIFSFGLLVLSDSTSFNLIDTLKYISFHDLLIITALLIVTTSGISALFLISSFYARNFKEGQSYCRMIHYLFSLLTFSVFIPYVKLDTKWALVPVTNIALAVKIVIEGGQSLNLVNMVIVINLIFTVILVYGSLFLLKNENVLFRE